MVKYLPKILICSRDTSRINANNIASMLLILKKDCKLVVMYFCTLWRYMLYRAKVIYFIYITLQVCIHTLLFIFQSVLLL